MARIDILVGTNNPAKFGDAAFLASQYPQLTLYRPSELNISIDPDETGSTYTENARIKRDFYMAELVRLALPDYYVISDDSGFEVDALGGKPGIHSRRWKDGVTPMTDQAIIDYCLEQLQDVPDEKRTVNAACTVSIGQPGTDFADDISASISGDILREPEMSAFREGFPFRALFFIPEHGRMLSDLVDTPYDQRPEGFRTHRENALSLAFAAIIAHHGQKV
jgi:XTP/dITP diphosphohydrolase